MTTKQLIYTALFASIGIVLPQAFHFIGGSALGTIFLPMHLPVLIGAMLLGPLSGVIIALVSLTIGVMIGMPPMPIAIFMAFEMTTYALVAGYLYSKKDLNIFASLIIAKLSGMIVSLIAINIAIILFSLALPPLFGSIAMFTISIPGIVIQLILVPIIVIRVKGAFESNEGLS